MKQKIIEFLLDNADPSIVLRVKREILNCLSNKEEEELLNRIMLQKNVQIVLRSQKVDGWFGNNFHGQSPKQGAGMYDNMEVGLRYLAEKGFSPENDYIKRAVASFLLEEPFFAECRRKAPDTDYTYTASGLYLKRSSIIIRAGYEYLLPKNDFIDLKYDIDFSFNTFLNVLNYISADDALDTHKRKLCFKSEVLWPCMYDLRMLAYSLGWRSKNSMVLLANSVNHLFSFLHSDEMVYTYIKGQYYGPCFAFINSQMKNLGILDKENISLEIMELFARCGIIKRVELLREKYEYLLESVDENLNVNINIDKRKSHGWSPYFGFALEEDWKEKVRIKCDLLYRVLLILYYSEFN